jgi:hypothetical protein
MPANKRITDLTDYTSVLPYASELFGVYQPLIGWRSKRQLRRFTAGTMLDERARLIDITRQLVSDARAGQLAGPSFKGDWFENSSPETLRS